LDVLQHLDSQLEMRYQGEYLITFEQASGHPVRVMKFESTPGQETLQSWLAQEEAVKIFKPRTPYKSAANHP
jgi:hypothetical protein